MIQAVATFGAGVFAGQGLSACHGSLPSCGLRGHGDDHGTAFKLSVHVHRISASELEPSPVLRPQPQLEVCLGQARKCTEVADFTDAAAARGLAEAGTGAADGGPAPAGGAWGFGETLTFAAQLGDVLGVGLRLQLSARSDVCLGPLRVQLPRTRDLGEAALSLRRAVLPACEPAAGEALGGSFGGSGRPEWRTPALSVPLARTGDGLHSGIASPAVAHVVLSVSVNADPEALLRRAEELERPLVEQVVDPVVQCIEAPSKCVREAAARWAPLCSGCRPARRCQSPVHRAQAKGSSMNDDRPLCITLPMGSGAYATCEVPAFLAAECPGHCAGMQPTIRGPWAAEAPCGRRHGCCRSLSGIPEVAPEAASSTGGSDRSPASRQMILECSEHRARRDQAPGRPGDAAAGRRELPLAAAAPRAAHGRLASAPPAPPARDGVHFA